MAFTDTELSTEFAWESPLAEGFAPADHEAEQFLGTASRAPLGAGRGAFSPVGTLTAEGTKQGKFKGDVAKSEQIAATLVSYSVVSPRDAASGQATGKRKHAPLVVRQSVAPSTVQFYNALTTNEVLKSFTFAVAGLKISLGKATVSGFRLLGETGVVEIAFVYQSIEIEHPSSGSIAVDSWSTPV